VFVLSLGGAHKVPPLARRSLELQPSQMEAASVCAAVRSPACGAEACCWARMLVPDEISRQCAPLGLAVKRPTGKL